MTQQSIEKTLNELPQSRDTLELVRTWLSSQAAEGASHHSDDPSYRPSFDDGRAENGDEDSSQSAHSKDSQGNCQ